MSGYAFEIALATMGAPISLVICNLPNKVQTLNEMFSNSCQLANALVTNTKKYLEESPDLKSAMKGSPAGLVHSRLKARNILTKCP